MSKPLLQIALDHLELSQALASAQIISPYVDVLEVGTLLCYAEGARAVAKLRENHVNYVILADLKVADAGGTAAELVFSQGATWMTVICCAPLATMEAALKVARKYEGDIQVELYGDWTFAQAEQWLRLGLKQVVYHRGRDAAAAGEQWSEADIAKIRRLAMMGFAVSVTGGLVPQDIERFKGLPVKCFIAGRSLYQASNPVQVAKEFKQAIDFCWR
jgi:3-dehydro-L-gulonate-6-phosphate decarboxylase